MTCEKCDSEMGKEHVNVVKKIVTITCQECGYTIIRHIDSSTIPGLIGPEKDSPVPGLIGGER